MNERWFWIFWGLWMLVIAAILAAVIFVAWHFAEKYW